VRGRSFIGVGLAVLVVAGVSACGGGGASSNGGGGASDNGVASKSPSAIFDATSAAVDGLTSVHISGSLVSGGEPITLDLHLVAGKGAIGSMSEHGLGFKIVAVNNVAYINGSPAFWKHFGGAAAATLFNGKWLRAPASTGSFSSLGALTNLHKLFGALLSTKDALAKGATSTVDGQKVVAVRDVSKGGTLYVATTGKPYPIEIVKTGSESGTITFDQFNDSVTLTAPSSSISISQLEKAAG
jgi:hypothetical protein